MLTDLPRAAAASGKAASIFSNSQHFRPLVTFNPYYKDFRHLFWVSADKLIPRFDLGNGHMIQRLARAFRLNVDIIPRGCLHSGQVAVKKRVVLHFEPGSGVIWQRQHVHPRAREVYPSTFKEIQRFIDSNPSWEVYEVGSSPSGLLGVGDWTGLPLIETIRRMGTCEFFVGITSGPVHIAAALSLNLITIVNFPPAHEIVLPTLKNLGVRDMEWLYPQSVHLHQDDESDLVPRVSSENLNKAFAGEIYPFRSNNYLNLINEKCS